MSIDVALSTRRGVGRDTYSLPQKNAATPQVARQWVRPRSSAMSIDVALSTRRDVGRDTYSLPQKKNAAAPRVARQWVRPRSSAKSIYVALSTRRGVGRDTYSLPQKNEAALPVPCQRTQGNLLCQGNGTSQEIKATARQSSAVG